MPRGKTLDKDKLYKLAQEGKSAQAIMKELKITNKMTLKSALADLMMEKGKVIQVAGLAARSSGNRKFTKLGILISRAQLEPQFKQGDQFEMEINGNKIILTKV